MKVHRRITQERDELTKSSPTTIVKTYPKVSQFWTYDPKQFVEQPVFSRDFPPSKNLE
jgi:branched-chain amino acid transport system substrate-binding protein